MTVMSCTSSPTGSRTGRPRHVLAIPALVVAALLVNVAPASAHPFLGDGGRVPVQSLATIRLDLAHGCGDEQTGAGRDTDEVALEVPPWMRVIDVPAPDGWEVAIGALDDDRGVVTWTATTGAVPAPRFALDVVVEGAAGETRFLRVSQRCGDVVARWVGTAEDPSDLPAVRVRLTEPDPSSPPPPPPAPAPAPPPLPQTPSTTATDDADTTGPAVVSRPDSTTETVEPARDVIPVVLTLVAVGTLSLAAIGLRRYRRR
jgi:hypothetical protein